MEGSDLNHGQLHGDLTIKDVTRPITLDVAYSGILKSPWGMEQAGFSATGKLNRKDFGLNWNVALETGGWLVSDEITINIDLELGIGDLGVGIDVIALLMVRDEAPQFLRPFRGVSAQRPGSSGRDAAAKRA